MAGAPGDIERTFFDALLGTRIVAGLHILKESSVTTAPCVDSLLDVSDLEEGALVRGVLNGFVDQVLDDGPLRVVGILKLIEQPVVIACVETVIDP